MALQLGSFGAWFNPVYDDSARVKFVVESEALGYTTAWLGRCGRPADPAVVAFFAGALVTRDRYEAISNGEILVAKLVESRSQ